MRTFFEFILSEIGEPTGGAQPQPAGVPSTGNPSGGPGDPMGSPVGMPPTGGGMPPMGGPAGGGMPPMGGGPAGGPPGADPMNGGAPAATPQPPKEFKVSDVWSVLSKILDGKKVGLEKPKKETGDSSQNMVNSGQPSQLNQPSQPIPGQPPQGAPGVAPGQPPTGGAPAMPQM